MDATVDIIMILVGVIIHHRICMEGEHVSLCMKMLQMAAQLCEHSIMEGIEFKLYIYVYILWTWSLCYVYVISQE